MRILAIDPGTTKSGVVLWNNYIPTAGTTVLFEPENCIENPGVMRNEDIIDVISGYLVSDVVAIEWIQSYGMAVGKSTFETCLWAGRFVQIALETGINVRLIPRGAIKMHHCGSMRAKDGNVSQALRDKFGEKGTKKDPGFFFGVASHAWQACAVAAYVAEGAEDEKELRF